MPEERTRPTPEGYIHIELPPAQARGFDRLFATLTEAFDEFPSDGHDGKCPCHEAIICPDE